MSYDIEHKMETKHLISSYIEGKLIIFKILSTPSPQFNVDGQRFMKNIQKSDIMNLDVFIKKMTTSYFLYVLRKIRSSSQHWIGGKGLKNCISLGKNDYFLLCPLKKRENEIVLKYWAHREIFSENEHSFYVVQDFRFFIFISLLKRNKTNWYKWILNFNENNRKYQFWQFLKNC